MNVAGNNRVSYRNNPLLRGAFDKDILSENNNALELNFYATPPNYELSIDEFESLALARLKVRMKGRRDGGSYLRALHHQLYNSVELVLYITDKMMHSLISFYRCYANLKN